MSWDALAPFIFACVIIESTPGPNMAFLTIVSATRGRRYGFATVLGVTLGLLIIGLAAAAGLATLISKSTLLYEGLRYSGVLYLLYLAVSEWRDADEQIDPDAETDKRLSSFFRHGLIVNVLNPKAGVFYVTVLPSFIAPNESILEQALTLTIIYVVIATAAHLLILSLAGYIKPLLDRPERKRLVRRAFAALLALVALWFGFSA